MTPPPPDAPPGQTMTRSYVGVLVIWIAVLAALYAMQELFS